MNIVLIHPYITVRDPAIFLSEPLGLVCLASYLRQVFGEEINIRILDLYAIGAGKPQKKADMYVLGASDSNIICAEIKKMMPDLIGITCNFTAYAGDSLEIAKIIKRAMPHVPLVMGGAHATIEADAILTDHPFIDFVIRGEGEITLEQLVRAIKDQSHPFSGIAGLTYRHQGKVLANPDRTLIADLNILPMPDRSFIDMERYKILNARCVWYVRQKPVATVMTSRGCPYNCIFCSTKVVWRRSWRARSLAHVFDEIEDLVARFGIREIIINDDQFFTERQRVADFCDYFIARNLRLCFTVDAGVSVWLVDEDLLTKMRACGFYALRFPIETGNAATLKFIHKPVDLAGSRTLIATANKLGFWTSANFIIGFPYETHAEIEETIRYAYACALDFASFLIAKPNAGSDLYDFFKKEGLLANSVVRASDFYRSDYDTTTMTARELNSILAQASRQWFLHKFLFYIKPMNFMQHLYPKLKTARDVRYFFKIFFVLLARKVVPAIARR